MNVALAFNVKHKNIDAELEFDSPSVIKGIEKALTELGHIVYKVEADQKAFLKLNKLKNKIDIVFNIAEGLSGDARESQIPMFCEVLKIPYTHSTPSTHAITLDKQFTKWILEGADVARVPKSQTISGKDYKIDKSLKYPLIIKPNKEGSSKGIVDKNVVKNESELIKRIPIVSQKFNKEVIIEEFLDGREFTVAVLGNKKGGFDVLPIVEQRFDFLPKGMNKIAGFELKWVYEDNLKKLSDAYICPAKLDKNLQNEIETTSKKICKVLDVRDAARIDYRLNSSGKLYFLEINTLPGINPDEKIISYFPLASRTAGMSFKEMVGRILESSINRYQI